MKRKTFYIRFIIILHSNTFSSKLYFFLILSPFHTYHTTSHLNVHLSSLCPIPLYLKFFVKEFHREEKATVVFRYLPFELKKFFIKSVHLLVPWGYHIETFLLVLFSTFVLQVVVCCKEIASYSCKRIISHYIFTFIF